MIKKIVKINTKIFNRKFRKENSQRERYFTSAGPTINRTRVRDSSENPFLICLFGEGKKIAANGPPAFSAGTPTKKAGRPKIFLE